MVVVKSITRKPDSALVTACSVANG
jgi:hypothetical protein